MFQNLLNAIHSFIVRMMFGIGSTPTVALVPVRRRRGATFIEYALLAAVAVAVFMVLNSLLPGLFSGIINRVRTALGL